MKIIRILILCACTMTLIGADTAKAMSTIPQPQVNTSNPDIIATTIIAGTQLEHLELFNQTDTPINLTEWRLLITGKGEGPCTTPQTISQPIATNWLLPKQYFTLSQLRSLPAECSRLTAFQILQKETVIQSVQIADSTLFTNDKAYQHKQRAHSPSSLRSASGTFEADYTKVIPTSQAVLYSDPLYTPPASSKGLQIVEILPNARNCMPTDTDLSCNDFIKLYNPTEVAIHLADYRLRIGYKGQAESANNTFTWGQIVNPDVDEVWLEPHSFFTLTQRNNGQPLNITDSGSFVWLEDVYGTSVYDPVLAYPDGSSTTKVGYSWALNGDVWQWSSSPQPDLPNQFPPELEANAKPTPEAALQPCAENQYRSAETNRCRNIVNQTTVSSACKEGQTRHPETNRCRSTLASSAEAKPCEAGQERNPETNRCRKVPAPANGHIKGTSDKTESASHFTWIVGLATTIAVGYAAYEWRHDIAMLFSRIKGRLANLATKFKP